MAATPPPAAPPAAAPPAPPPPAPLKVPKKEVPWEVAGEAPPACFGFSEVQMLHLHGFGNYVFS